jgi:hypothetical protein
MRELLTVFLERLSTEMASSSYVGRDYTIQRNIAEPRKAETNARMKYGIGDIV